MLLQNCSRPADVIPRLHDTTGCQTGLYNRLTAGLTIVLCRRGFREQFLLAATSLPLLKPWFHVKMRLF